MSRYVGIRRCLHHLLRLTSVVRNWEFVLRVTVMLSLMDHIHYCACITYQNQSPTDNRNCFALDSATGVGNGLQTPIWTLGPSASICRPASLRARSLADTISQGRQLSTLQGLAACALIPPSNRASKLRERVKVDCPTVSLGVSHRRKTHQSKITAKSDIAKPVIACSVDQDWTSLPNELLAIRTVL